MGQGLRHKECPNYILHPGLEFSDDLDCYTVWFTRLDKAAKFLGKAENELRGKFFFLQFSSKYDHLRHAHIIMHSRI